jgi:four helix bundle protein
MSKGQTFQDLLVWQKAIELAAEVYALCRREPLARDQGLRDQMQRAVVSVSANIAEGYERSSRKEYLHFLAIAKGSNGEVRSLLLLAERIACVDKSNVEPLVDKSRELSRMLQALINSLRSSSSIYGGT